MGEKWVGGREQFIAQQHNKAFASTLNAMNTQKMPGKLSTFRPSARAIITCLTT